MTEEDPSSAHQRSPVARQYNTWAEIYDWFWARYMNQTLPVLRRTAHIEPDERVLDLGCGTGEFERQLIDTTPGVDVVGVDFAASMVDRARSKFGSTPGVRFVQADVHDLPFSRASFDVLTCANTFHYFGQPEVVLTEASRVLRPQGRLVLLDWCRDFWTCQVMDAVLRWTDPAYRTCYTLEELRRLMGGSALRPRYSFRYRFDGIWGMMVVEAVLPPFR